MNVVSRRDAMRFSGLTLATTFTAPLLSAAAFAEQRPAQNQATTAQGASSAPPLNSDLVMFVNNQLLTTWANLRKGSAQSNDLVYASNCIHLYSNHFDQTGLDATIRSVAPQLDPVTAGTVKPQHLDKFLAYCQQYDSSIKESDIWHPPSSAQAVSSTIRDLGNLGPSVMMHQAADRILAFSKTVKGASSGGASTASMMPAGNLHEAIYEHTNGGNARLLNVQSYACTNGCNPWISHCDPPKWCADISTEWAILWAAVSIVIQQCVQNPTAFAFCSALMGEIAALGLALADILFWVTTAIGIILAIICG